VLEKIPRTLAKRVTEVLDIPTIGIGAGPSCDGQILVLHDMLGLYEEFSPKFVKQYARLAEQMRHAVQEYKKDVRAGKFPGPEHSFE
jgi:3-methyl-2-oxobutanoate hydroxymethyltransferase